MKPWGRTGRRRLTWLLCALLTTWTLAAGGPAAATSTAPWVTTQGTRFVSSAGGSPVVLRGVNVGVSTSSSQEGQVVTMGANLVRIHVCWSDLEPTAPDTSHHWNSSLLAQLDAQVAWYQAHHVNILIDLHQFNWSAYFSTRGCGIPTWFYTHTEAGRFAPTGIVAAFNAFYTDPTALRMYSAVAQMLAQRYQSSPAVVGYEVLNEPYGANNHDGTQRVVEFEAAVRRAIMDVDSSRTVFVMTRYGGDKGLLDASFTPFGDRTHLVLDYHSYFAARPGTGMTFNGEDWLPSWAATHLHTSTDYRGTEAAQLSLLQTPINKANDLGIPLLVGEWGARRDDVGEIAYQTQMLDLFSRHGLSWARWSLSANDMFGLLAPGGTVTPAFTQLSQAMHGAVQPPPAPGPIAPSFGLSKLSLTAGSSAYACYRPARDARQVTLGVRTSSGVIVRQRLLGPAAAGSLRCTLFKGLTATGSYLPTGTYYLRVTAGYTDGVSRFSVWHTIAFHR